MDAEDIFGPDIGPLKVKTVRKSSQQVPHSYVITTPPPDVHGQYRLVTMYIDIMFVNKIEFFVSIPQVLKSGSAKYIPNRQHDTIIACVKGHRSLYKLNGFVL